jgi:hypothetical protein
MTLPNPLTLDELAFVIILSLPFIVWGFQHGLDAVMIAVVGTLAGMLFADTLAEGMATWLNLTWRMSQAVLEGGAEGIGRYREFPGLIETDEQLRLAGTILFLLIVYVSFRFAFRRAGGRKNVFEGIFGAIGAAVTGYIIITFLIPRHLRLPQQVEIVETQLPVINLDANVLVIVALIVIVFGVQGAKKKK